MALNKGLSTVVLKKTADPRLFKSPEIRYTYTTLKVFLKRHYTSVLILSGTGRRMIPLSCFLESPPQPLLTNWCAHRATFS